MTVDLGTGDGHFVLDRAAARPKELVLGVDASHAAMAEASRRAGRSARRGGLPNARFIVAAVETLSGELDGLADLVTVTFPWGSLLHGAMGTDPVVASRIAGLVGGGGRLRLLVSAATRDARRGVVDVDCAAILAAYRHLGLVAREVRPATLADVHAARSSWGRRLFAGGTSNRHAWLIELDHR